MAEPEVFEEVLDDDDEEILSESAIEELVEDDDSADTYESVNASGSSSRVGRRSSRRSAKASGKDSKRSSRRSARKELTPEEKIAKRKAQMAFIKLIVGLGVAAGVVILLLQVLKPDPQLEKARNTIKMAREQLVELDNLIEHSRIEQAEELYGQIEEALAAPGFATFGPEMVGKVEDLQGELEERGPSIVRSKDNRSAKRNFEAIKERLDKITSAEQRANPTIDLDQLLIDITDFRNNPVDPKGGMQLSNAEVTYKAYMGQLAGAEGRIKSEREYRGNTGAVEDLARIEIERLVTERKYKRGYEVLENYKAENPNADFSGIERNLDTSVAQAWDGARRKVEDFMKTANSDGASAVMREENRKKAKDVLQKVMSDYNDTYVRQARDLLDEHDL